MKSTDSILAFFVITTTKQEIETTHECIKKSHLLQFHEPVYHFLTQL